MGGQLHTKTAYQRMAVLLSTKAQMPREQFLVASS